MKELYEIILRKKVSNLIKKIGNGVNEIVFDIPTSLCVFNTIELKNDIVILHLFEEDLQYDTLFDDLLEEDKLQIYKLLKNYE